MDDVSSEICFSFNKLFSKSSCVHQIPFFLSFAILGIGRYGEKLTKVKKRFDLKGKI